MAKRLCVLLLPLWTAAALVFAGEKPQIPPPGVEIPAADRAELEAGVKQLGDAIAKLREKYKDNEKMMALLPDIEIFRRAVHSALAYNEFLNVKEIPGAKALLKQGMERAARLLGAVHRLQETLNLSLIDLHRAEYDNSMAATRSALGDAAFEAAWAEGYAMTTEQAVEYALSEDG